MLSLVKNNCFRTVVLTFCISILSVCLAHADETVTNKKTQLEIYNEYQEISKKLQQFQIPVVEKDAALQNEIKNLQKLITAKWEENADKAKINMEEFEKLMEKINAEKTTEEEKQKLIAQYNETASKIQKIKMATLQDGEIVKAETIFAKNLRTATVKNSPEASKLYDQLDQLKNELSLLQ